MLLQPNGVAPARVRQRQEIGPIVAPVAHRLGKRRLTPPAEVMTLGVHADQQSQQIGRASCRERVCPYVSISVGAVALIQKLSSKQTILALRMQEGNQQEE